MQAATPTITPDPHPEELETYPCGSIALLGKVRTSASCPCSLCSPLSPQGSVTHQAQACDDTPKWREILAAREEEETVKRQCQMKQRLASSPSKKLFLSPAKTSFKHKVETGKRCHATWSKRESETE